MNRLALSIAILTVAACVARAQDVPPASAPASPASAPAAMNQRMLMLLADEFPVTEFWWTYYSLCGAGYVVDVAAPEKGLVRVDDRVRDNDAPANLSLADVDIRNYAGLVIPGGRASQKLQNDAKALEICRQFAQAGKIVAGIGQAQRLLALAGVLKGRACTFPWAIADDLADAWKQGLLGQYLDQPVAVDGTLITGRSSADLEAFLSQLTRAVRIGPAVDAAHPPRLAVINPGAPRRMVWAAAVAPTFHGIDVQEVAVKDLATFAASCDANALDLLVVLDGRELDELKATPALASLVSAMGSDKARPRVAAVGPAAEMLGELKLMTPGVAALKGRTEDLPFQIVSMARAAHRPGAAAEPNAAPYTAVLALAEGFDERVVIGMECYLRFHGFTVLRVGPSAGFVRGMGRLPIQAAVGYDAPGAIAADATIIAPGGLWPRGSDSQRRIDWILERYKGGARGVAFGLDSLELASQEALAGKSFATSDQARSSFSKDGGRYSDARATLTAERLVTAKGADCLSDAIRLLEPPDPPHAK